MTQPLIVCKVVAVSKYGSACYGEYGHNKLDPGIVFVADVGQDIEDQQVNAQSPCGERGQNQPQARGENAMDMVVVSTGPTVHCQGIGNLSLSLARSRSKLDPASGRCLESAIAGMFGELSSAAQAFLSKCNQENKEIGFLFTLLVHSCAIHICALFLATFVPIQPLD